MYLSNKCFLLFTYFFPQCIYRTHLYSRGVLPPPFLLLVLMSRGLIPRVAYSRLRFRGSSRGQSRIGRGPTPIYLSDSRSRLGERAFSPVSVICFQLRRGVESIVPNFVAGCITVA